MLGLKAPLLPPTLVNSFAQSLKENQNPENATSSFFKSALSKVRDRVSTMTESKKSYKGNRWFKEIIDQVKKFIIEKVEYSIKMSFKSNALLLTQNSRFLLLAVNSGSIATFDTKKKILISETKLPQDTIFRILLTLDEKYLITCGDGNDIFIYQYPGYNLVATLKGHNDHILRLAQTPDSNWLYSASHDGEIRRWSLIDFSGGDCIATHEGMCKALAINPNGDLLFSGGNDMVIKVTGLVTEQEVKELKGHEDCVWAIEVAPSGLYVASASDDLTVRVWSVIKLECIKVFYGHTARPTVLTFTTDSSKIITGSLDGTVRVWHMDFSKTPIVMKGYSGGVRFLLVNPINNQIFSIGNDRNLRICSLPEDGETEFLTTHTSPITSAHSNSSLKFIVSTDARGHIKIWDWVKNSSRNFTSISKAISSSYLAKDDSYLILGTQDGDIILINLTTEKLSTFKSHDSAIRAITLNDAMTIMMTDSSDFKIAVWDFPTIQLKYFMRGHTNLVTKILILSDTKAISGGADSSIKIWSLKRKKASSTLLRHDSAITCLSVSSNKESLFSADSKGAIHVWNLKNKQHESSFCVHEASICNLHVSKDDLYLISADLSGRVSFWHLPSRQRITYIHIGNISCFTVDSIEEYLITGQGKAVVVHKNPMKAKSLSIYGPFDQKGKLLSYLSQILITKKNPEYDSKHDDWIIMPYRINLLHIYAYLGLEDHIKLAVKNRFNMMPSIQDDTILTLCINCGDNLGTQVICEKLCEEVIVNPYILSAIEDKLVLINQKGNPSLYKLYNSFVAVCTDESLPKSSAEGIDAPIFKLSDTRGIDPVQFIGKSEESSEGDFVVFKQSLIRINVTSGSSRSIEFLESLRTCPNSDIFRSEYIVTLLKLKWNLCRFYMYIQGLVFLAYIILLCYYTITQSYNVILMIALLSINFTLLAFEFVKMRINGKSYWSHSLNWLDLIRSASCIAYLLFFLLELQSDWYYEIFTLVTLTTWVRGVVYFRIFESTRYLSRLLYEVVVDFRAFLFVLAYTTLSLCFITMVMDRNFGETAFEDNIFIAYKLNLGDVNDVYTEKFSYIMFAVVTTMIIINPIIMLNLLISIIGDTFERVQSTRVVADMKELCEMVIEVERLLFWRRNNDQKHYIQICNSKEEDEQPEEAWEGLIIELDKKLTFVKDNIIKYQERNQDKLKDIQDYLNSTVPSIQKQLESQGEMLKELNEDPAKRLKART